MPRFGDPEPLGPDHQLGGFDCGVDSLDTWLPKHARAAAASGSARTYVIDDAEQSRVVGYHALCVARLAVDRSVQGRGIGAFLLRDAMVRTLAAAAELGIRIMLVHALNESARSFYLHHGFESSSTDQMNLQLLVKDIEASVGEVLSRHL